MRMTVFHLPPEILEQIFQYTPVGYRGQLDHWSFCLVSRSWYASCIRRLYHTPSIIGKNFDAFTRTLCPSVNANIRRSELALFVRQLDMGKLVYSGSKSLTARVLGRVKAQLELLIAPATTFSLLAFSALSKCERLRILNLEYVIESMDAVLLLRTVKKLKRLETLSFRMVWVNPQGKPKPEEVLDLPSSLRRLTITGICEPAAAILLYDAIGRSQIHSLAIMLGGPHQRALFDAFQRLKLKRLYLDISVRSAAAGTGYDSYTLSDILCDCHYLEELSIPLLLLCNSFFTNNNVIQEPFNLRKLTIHPSSFEISGPVLLDWQWEQLINDINGGNFQYLEEIHVLDRKDVVKFEELETIVPGGLDQLDQALFDERLESSGLFLAGREDFS